jgi:predicted transcriptional regulator YdeE
MKKILSILLLIIAFVSNINAEPSSKIIVYKDTIIVGLKITTNLQNVTKDSEKLWQDFLTKKLDNTIPHRSNKNKYVVTTNYNGENFDIIVGVPVNQVDGKTIDPKLSIVSIKSGKYINFKTKAGQFPKNLKETWGKIYSDNQLAKERKYSTDYEVYTPKSLNNLNNAQIDIFISVNK